MERLSGEQIGGENRRSQPGARDLAAKSLGALALSKNASGQPKWFLSRHKVLY
jgi:hypothetical protein